MLTKYRLNQFLLLLSAGGYVGNFWAATWTESSLLANIGHFAVATGCLHYLLNLVHIGSHNLLSKRRSWNSFLGNVAGFFGGVTFADFRLTHLRHHRYLDDPQEDPDYFITNSGPWFTIPFKIFYHDVFFFRRGLYKSQHSWRGYLLTRLAQAATVSLLVLLGLKSVWISLWLLPMLLLGLANGLFLFYFPHYIPKLETRWRARPSLWNYPARTLIDVSRVFHERHHDSIQTNLNYFPLLAATHYLREHGHLRFGFHHEYTRTA